jgi:hypothetical protein
LGKIKNIKYFALLIVIIGLSYLGFKGYRNYQKNEIIKYNNSHITFSDRISRFTKFTDSDIEYDLNQSLLVSITRIKDSITTEFLNITTEKIGFFDIDIDTLNIKSDNRLNYNYLSTLDKGNYDKKFNDILVKSLEPFLSKNNIKEIEIYTLTPTEYDSIPPIPGTLTNFDY